MTEKPEAQYQARADLIVDVVNDILCFMEDKNISKSQLAVKMDKSKAAISRMLSVANEHNMTLSTLADIGFALGFKPKFIIDGDAHEKSVLQYNQIVANYPVVVSKMRFLEKQVDTLGRQITQISTGTQKPTWSEPRRATG